MLTEAHGQSLEKGALFDIVGILEQGLIRNDDRATPEMRS